MSSASETLLASLPGCSAGQRVQIVLISSPESGSRMELRQQSYGEGVGWFTQSAVALEPEQVAELRGVLGTTGAARLRPLPASFRQAPPPAQPALRLYSA